MNPLYFLLSAAATGMVGAALVALGPLVYARDDAEPGNQPPSPSQPRFRAVLSCAGPKSSSLFYRYEGAADCRLVKASYGGDRVCGDSCVGYGTCRDICPIGAIEITADGTPVVSDECDGCGLCVKECPTGTLRLVPWDADFHIRCSSSAPAAERSSFCPEACDACGICTSFSGGGFSLRGGLAEIDYRTRGDRTLAARACPRTCIARVSSRGTGKNAFQSGNNRLKLTERAKGAAERE